MDVTDLTPLSLLLSALALFAGATCKGLTGVGLPLIAVPIIALVTTPQLAITTLVIPILASNVLQTVRGGHVRANLRRFWPVLVTLVPSLVASAFILASLPAAPLMLILGVVLMVSAALSLARPTLTLSPRAETLANPVVGVVAGVLGGITSFYGPPMLLYLSGLRLPPDRFVSAIGMLYFCGGATLLLALAGYGMFTPASFALSVAACLPMVPGLMLGMRLRRHVPAHLFRTIILSILILLGAHLVARAVIA